MTKAKLIDTSKCLFCNACTVECKRENNVVVGRNISWTQMALYETGQFPDVKQYYIKDSCKHCTDAACAEVCPVEAISHHADGFVVQDQAKCIGCGACVNICPFGVPQLDKVDKKANKCNFCVHRTANGGQPACASACPFGAIMFGNREELIQVAKDRVTALQAKGAENVFLYGEEELGGLHVMYILQDNATVYGLPEQPKYPGMAALWQKIARSTGGLTFGFTAVGMIAGFVIKRRNMGFSGLLDKEE